MKAKNNILFWSAIFVILTLLFSRSLSSLILGFYFVSFLFPVILGTSFFFNHFLVPKYLLDGQRWKFFLYLAYMLIISVYLELLVMILAFAILGNYQIENLGNMSGDIYVLSLTLYFIVFVYGFISILKGLKMKNSRLSALEEEKEKNASKGILIKVNRKNVRLEIQDLAYIESLSDYVKIHTRTDQYITKEKISTLEDALPSEFLRIHRSFLVNRQYIKHFGSEEVQILKQNLPVGRKYKKEFLANMKL